MSTPRIVAVAMKKGGVGKTTTVLALAAIAQERGIDVGVIDLDAQGSATLALGQELSDNAAAMLIGDMALDDAWVDTGRGVRLVPGGPGTESVEKRLAADHLGGLQALTGQIANSKRLPELVIIDTRPDEAHGVLNTYMAATEVWVVVETAPAAIEALPRVIETITKVGTARGRVLPVTAIIPTKFDARTRTDSNALKALRNAFGDAVTVAIPASSKVREAHGARVLLPTYARLSPPVTAYRAVADQLFGKGKS